MALKTLGVHASTAPVKRSTEIRAAEFGIAGLIGRNNRAFAEAYRARSYNEAIKSLQDADSAYYLQDAIKSFFDNLRGTEAEIWIKTNVGNDGTTIDAVVASDSPVDGSAVATLKIEAADFLYTKSGYKKLVAYGTAGNRIGYQIDNGDRFTTAAAAANTAASTSAVIDSTIDVKVGDIVKMVATGGGGATVYQKITDVDESTGTISWSGVFHATANLEVDDAVTVIGFKIKTYLKSDNGVVTEVDTETGKRWCTMESEVADYYVENVFAQSPYIKVTDLASASVLEASFPVDVATTTFLTSGVNGTAPTTSAMWADDLTAFDNIDIRALANVETSDATIQKAGEAYCGLREAKPIWFYLLPENQTKAQLTVLGQGYQRSDEVSGVIIANWYGVQDPFTTSATAPNRNIPNCGGEIAKMIRSIAQLGIHYIYANEQVITYGVNEVVGDTFQDDDDRTDLAEAGVNVIQNVPGVGIYTRNAFTPSTDTAYKFLNALLMKSFFQATFVDSLRTSENTPNSLNRIASDRDKMLNFMYTMWRKGSNNVTPEGEFYGQYQKDDGSISVPEEHFSVQSDATVNPLSELQDGNRFHLVYFTYPAPTGRIEISVGIQL